MNNREYRQQRAKVTDDIRRKVSELVQQEKDWESKKKHPSGWYRSVTARMLNIRDDKNPSLRSYEELLREVKNNSRVENPSEKPWSTALLNESPVIPDLIPWLCDIQFNRKSYLSKLLTLREVKWLIRLSGFRDLTNIRIEKRKLNNTDLEKEGNEDLRKTFVSNVVSTWAQIYAFREQVDSLARIKESNYSDLDIAIADNNYQEILGYIEDKVLNIIRPAERDTKADRFKLIKEYTYPMLMEHIIYSEMNFLEHSLGQPDMSPESLKVYIAVLLQMETKGEKLSKFPYGQRLESFLIARRFSKYEPEKFNTESADKIWMEVFRNGQGNILKTTQRNVTETINTEEEVNNDQ